MSRTREDEERWAAMAGVLGLVVLGAWLVLCLSAITGCSVQMQGTLLQRQEQAQEATKPKVEPTPAPEEKASPAPILGPTEAP